MMIPTIHTNWDNQSTLYDQYYKALDTIHTTINTLQKMTPNGRNYYPQGQDAIVKAVAEHTARMSKLYSVRTDLERMLEAIADA